MRQKVLIFIVSYNAEHFIESVLSRIPEAVWASTTYDPEVLLIDDQSSDQTVEKARRYAIEHHERPITVLYNTKNQGYGGNQKIGYHYAIQNHFDAVVLLHGDGQYAPEFLPQMIAPLLSGTADVVLGSRMINRVDALKGRMPLYKWVGNQILTTLQNRILGSQLAEFHTGYRAYRVAALAAIPFSYNSDYFDFDTDILIQLLDTGNRIKEIAIPTFYGDEISRVNGMKYAALIMRTSLLSRLVKFGIFYHTKFDYETPHTFDMPKLNFMSSHRFALDRVHAGEKVVDVGCGPGFIARELARKGAQTISIDSYIQPTAQQYSIQTVQTDVDGYDFESVPADIETVLLLDILEHLRSPEGVLRHIRERFSEHAPQVVVTTGNVGFFSMRIGLLFGQFNYGKRGILDMNHTRLFTFYSLRNMLVENGFDVLEERGIPAPFPLALGNTRLARLLLLINYVLILVSRTLFSYQIAMVARPRPTLGHLLKRARETDTQRYIDV